MIVNTRRLFLSLLRHLHVDVVCDVGSMNGSDAIAFRRAVPHAQVYAFEPNPLNFREMIAAPAFQAARIQAAELAASNLDGEAEFFVVAREESLPARRGMSSLYRRLDPWAPTASVVRVRTVRLDTFLGRASQTDRRIALWVDTEGKAYEVMEGISGLRNVLLIHVEVETAPCISAEQKLYPALQRLLAEMNYRQLASDKAVENTQFNALFVRADCMPSVRVFGCTALARMRYLLVAALLLACPTCVKELAAWRSRRSSSTHPGARTPNRSGR